MAITTKSDLGIKNVIRMVTNIKCYGPNIYIKVLHCFLSNKLSLQISSK